MLVEFHPSASQELEVASSFYEVDEPAWVRSLRMKSKTPAFSCQSIRPSVGRWMTDTVAFRSEGFHSFCSTGFAQTLCKSWLWRTSANVPDIGVVAGDC